VFTRLLQKLMSWGLTRTTIPFAYVIPNMADKTPYITRFLFPRAFLPVRPLLHHIHQADGDRDVHNHPWKWSFSLILKGSYTEKRWLGGDEYKTRRVRWFNFIRANDFHTIIELHGDVWTLFFAGPRTQDWGFQTKKGFVDHQTYLGISTPSKKAY
jgi:hypothetical protein